MKHYVQLPKRLPSARKLARTRSRALPFVIALPLVAVLWVTIGLPILFSAVTSSGQLAVVTAAEDVDRLCFMPFST